MNAPLIWIGIPLAAAVVLWFLRSRLAATYIVGGLCLLLVLLALLLPINSLITLGPWSLRLDDTFQLLGRKFIIEDQNRPVLTLMYLIGVVWFFSSGLLGMERRFAPLGLGITALMVAALSVEPFLYAALLVEMAVLFSIPMLVSAKRVPGQGILRFIIFQTMAMPFMLMAGWVAGNVGASPANDQLLNQAVGLLALGFAFWLAVFPFFAWLPLFAGESPPFEVGFILSLFPVSILILMLEFLDAFIWLRSYELLPPVLQFAGVAMVFTGGIGAAFERQLGRLLGYAVMIENGFVLLALSLGGLIGMEIMAASLAPRLLAFWAWSMAMAILDHEGVVLNFEGVRGRLISLPLVSGTLLLAFFSLAGLPLLAGFPIRRLLIEALTEQSLLVGSLAMVGMFGFMLSGFRMLTVFAGSEHRTWQIGEKWPQMVATIMGIVALLTTGVFPGWLSSGMLHLLESFGNLY
jgi:NADH-quinone oxidoreductase subunit N